MVKANQNGFIFEDDENVDQYEQRFEDGKLILEHLPTGLEYVWNEGTFSVDNEPVATLDNNGKIPSESLPDIAINDVFVTDEEDGRLTVEDDLDISVEPGDIVIETYPDPSMAYMKNETPYDDPDSWILISVLSSPVTSVFGKEGDITDQDAVEAIDGSEIPVVKVGDRLVNSIVQSESELPSSAEEGTQIYVKDEKSVFVYTE